MKFETFWQDLNTRTTLNLCKKHPFNIKFVKIIAEVAYEHGRLEERKQNTTSDTAIRNQIIAINERIKQEQLLTKKERKEKIE